MPALKLSEWRRLPLSLTELCIETTLRCGQSFRWRKIDDNWTCVLRGRLLSIKQDKDHLHYRVAWPPKSPKPKFDDTEELLRHYFSLKYDLGALYNQWSASDPNFQKKALRFAGIRILSQDAWEALVAFICSSNNNISRISQMVHKLCSHYGPLVGHLGGEAFHDFPSPQALTGRKVEAHLRELGFGYRAKYIAETAMLISMTKPECWLESLANPENPGWMVQRTEDMSDPPSYKHAHEQLLQLPGVGPKVADCVCLMGLGWGEAVPVDTHVWQIAQRDYKFGKTKSKTFSKAMYDSVGDHFRGIWGQQAGWAQSVLFTANLKSFSGQASAEPNVVDAKIKVEEEVPVQSPARSKKRRITVLEKLEVKETKPTDLGQESSKRRRTRSSRAALVE
ncbi:DNA glycosylase [Xylariomycetidae sp. FL0641]|nr:DNA glycosylase [Xylariomycetidae sp. FL0641]